MGVPRISVIVPAHDDAATLGRTLAALGAQRTAHSFEVIVVDDGSRDATAEIARRAGAPVRLVGGPHRGAAAARNLGASEARGSLLAFTDADCEPDVDWIEQGIAALGSADLVQGPVRPDPTAAPGPFDRTLWVTREAGLYETANLFCRRATFEAVGGFSRAIRAPGRPMGEDTWFGWRARRAGARTSFCDTAVVRHAVFPQTRRAYVRERTRRAHFPALAAKIPELRQQFFFGRYFLDTRTAAFDLAVMGGLVAALARRRSPLVLALPYAAIATRAAARGWRHAPEVLLVDLAADLVGLIALVRGSAASRSAVL